MYKIKFYCFDISMFLSLLLPWTCSSSKGQNGKDGYFPLIYVDEIFVFEKFIWFPTSKNLHQNNGVNFVEDEMIKYAIGGTSNDLISKKDLQSTPNMYVKNNTIYSVLQE